MLEYIMKAAQLSWVIYITSSWISAGSDILLACGYPETRTVFYPPIGSHDTTSAKTYREYFLKYDFEVRYLGELLVHNIDNSRPTRLQPWT
jgi:hypothetical protein